MANKQTNKPQLKTEVQEKTQEDKPAAIDPTITQPETEKAKEVKEAIQAAKAEEDEAKAVEAAKPAAETVDVSKVKGFKPEGAALVEAVKADAEKRGKTFEKCLVTGVLVVK